MGSFQWRYYRSSLGKIILIGFLLQQIFTMRISFKKYIILVCVTVLSLSTVAQIKVINNKGTFFQIDTSKWELVGVDIYNKNQIGNVGVGTFPYNARFVVDNGNSAILPAFKLKYPFSGAISDSILTWNPADSTVRKTTLLNLLTGNTIRSLNGLTGSTQTFAIGTLGPDFNIVSSGTTHTFNIPNASSTSRGLLTAADWVTFNSKIGAVTATTAAAVTTALSTATVQNTSAYWNANQLQGRDISTTPPIHGQVLTWNDTISKWEPESPGVTYENGIDIGYIVAWGSNTTPPDYLLPLSGGTYNWADFPHFQAFQTTHPSQFITDNGTTFTLKDINSSGRFLRGGLTAGVNQNGSTAMPINPFVLNNYTHNHSYNIGLSLSTTSVVTSALFASYGSILDNVTLNTSSTYNTNNDIHTHTVSGGDSETRPINSSVIWCLKVKPTMTAGDIIINTGSSTTTVSNSIVNNELTTTVNGVSSTPVTLPTYTSAVVEIYDGSGTQALSTSFSDITFGTTNIADAGYTVGGSGAQITVTTAGTYRITYRISARCTTNQGNAAEFQLTRNGTFVAGTRGYSKHHNTDRPHGTVTVVKILALSANDIIRVQGRQYSAFGSISLSQDGSSLIIERIK